MSGCLGYHCWCSVEPRDHQKRKHQLLLNHLFVIADSGPAWPDAQGLAQRMRQRVSTFPLPTATRRILPPTRGRVFLRAAVRGITVRERKVELRFCNQRTLVPFPSLRRDAGRLACASTRTIAVPSTGTAAGGDFTASTGGHQSPP